MKKSKKYIIALVFIHALVIAEIIFVHIRPMDSFVRFFWGIRTYAFYLVSVSLLIFTMEERVWSGRKMITIVGRKVYLTDLLSVFASAVMLVFFILWIIMMCIPDLYGQSGTEKLDIAWNMIEIGRVSFLVSTVVAMINIIKSKSKLSKVIVGVNLVWLFTVIAYMCYRVVVRWIEDGMPSIKDFY